MTGDASSRPPAVKKIGGCLPCTCGKIVGLSLEEGRELMAAAQSAARSVGHLRDVPSHAVLWFGTPRCVTRPDRRRIDSLGHPSDESSVMRNICVFGRLTTHR
jgi:hypothetical protein